MRTSKRKAKELYQWAPAIDSPQLPPAEEEIRQRAHEIYVARGGTEGMALRDWLQAKQELKQKL